MRSPIAFLALTMMASFSTVVAAQGPMQVAPSGRGTTEVVLTLVDSAARAAAKPASIKVDYGQPNLRGRKLLTDSLIPYDKPWRTGANAATTLTTDVDLVIGGSPIPKGKYIIQTIPSRTGWKLLIQKDVPPVAGAEPVYNPANDLARVDMRQTTAAAPLETLSMWLIPSRDPGPPHGQLVLAWGTISLATDWSMK